MLGQGTRAGWRGVNGEKWDMWNTFNKKETGWLVHEVPVGKEFNLLSTDLFEHTLCSGH